MKTSLKLFIAVASCICAALTAAEIKPPEFFKDWNEETHFDFPMYKGRFSGKALQIKDDSTSEIGKVVALEFPNPHADIKKYKEWIFFGIHDKNVKGLGGGAILWKHVKQPGWNWYKIATNAKLTKNCYGYFFTTWILQQPFGAAADITYPEQKYEVWVRVKLTGPTFPQGKADEKDGIYIERVVLKKIK